MPRRSRRSGVRFIEDDRDRSLTFFKRRYGIFKAASDLSTLTGTRVAVVLESINERFSSFGTPDASPIVDAFLSGDMPTEFDTSEEQKVKITNLQNEMFQLEKDKAMEDKRKKENIAWTKEIQETSRMTKYVYGKEDDLDATELYEMYRELSRIKQETDERLTTLLHDNNVEADGRLRDSSLLQPSWWRSMHPQVTPPKYSPWAPLQASFQHQGSSSSHQVLARLGSSCSYSVMFPSQQVQPKLQHRPLVPLAPSIVRLQAPTSKEAYPFKYNIRGLDISGKKSYPLSFSPISPSPPSQPPSLQTPPSNDSSPQSLSPQFSSPMDLVPQQLPSNAQNYNSLHPPQNYANASSTYELDFELGNTSGNGGQTGGAHIKGFDLSTPQQGDGCLRVTPEASSAGGISNGDDAGSNLGDLNFPWY
ncbi:hypothetical protein SETIT_5G225300v2 [Setaria italica]|uniref:MADS-box domain-containing protein n=1 Tax=Setaria italica TaxID=4555 RepID=A0A368R7Z0_SETIT|nr:transcription factor RLM1 [Setaria italica]RCV26184.1 hypothetical protein SETIT_5G225300v2 [Setaria italica]